MKETFVTKKFSAKSLELIETSNEIVAAYQAQGLRLTLRQLYYQLVSRNVIPNVERSYKNLASLISDARLAGMLDWDAIEDRVRVPRRPTEFDDLADLVETAEGWYQLPKRTAQDGHIELWVEKDALAGVLRPLAVEFHVTLMVNRGYSSQSAMYEASKRMRRAVQGTTDPVRLFYLGDHDPSGEDMVRDIRDRLITFNVRRLDVVKVALTMEQIEQYSPPPNPAKVTDPRAAAYIAEHGDSSWEVDALPPNVLAELIRAAIEPHIDRDVWDAILEREESDKERLRAAVEEV